MSCFIFFYAYVDMVDDDLREITAIKSTRWSLNKNEFKTLLIKVFDTSFSSYLKHQRQEHISSNTITVNHDTSEESQFLMRFLLEIQVYDIVQELQLKLIHFIC